MFVIVWVASLTRGDRFYELCGLQWRIKGIQSRAPKGSCLFAFFWTRGLENKRLVTPSWLTSCVGCSALEKEEEAFKYFFLFVFLFSFHANVVWHQWLPLLNSFSPWLMISAREIFWELALKETTRAFYSNVRLFCRDEHGSRQSLSSSSQSVDYFSESSFNLTSLPKVIKLLSKDMFR